MSQKSVIVVTACYIGSGVKIDETDVFTDLKTFSDISGFNYNTLTRKGDSFFYPNPEKGHAKYWFIQRKPILRKGGEEKEKKKIESNELP